MSRDVVLSDAERELLIPLVPSAPSGGRPFADHHRMVEEVVWRYRTESSWAGPARSRSARGSVTPGSPGSRPRTDPRHPPGSGGRRGADRLGGVHGLHDRPHPPARCAPAPNCRGAVDYTSLLTETADHGIGRPVVPVDEDPQLVDGTGLPLVVLLGAERGNDSPKFPVLLHHLRVPRPGAGTSPDTPGPGTGGHAIRGTRAAPYCAPAGSAQSSPRIATRSATATPRDSRRQATGVRPPVDYRGRNVVERTFAHLSNGAVWPPATTSTPRPTAAAPSCGRTSSASNGWETRPSPAAAPRGRPGRRAPGAPGGRRTGSP